MFFGTDHNLGSGLGLYITKEAVENLNGSITVTSEVKQGSTFTVIIPKYHEPDCCILLIEDNIIDQLVTTKLLKKTLGDLDISVVNNGREGIEWLHEHEKGLSFVNYSAGHQNAGDGRFRIPVTIRLIVGRYQKRDGNFQCFLPP